MHQAPAVRAQNLISSSTCEGAKAYRGALEVGCCGTVEDFDVSPMNLHVVREIILHVDSELEPMLGNGFVGDTFNGEAINEDLDGLDIGIVNDIELEPPLVDVGGQHRSRIVREGVIVDLNHQRGWVSVRPKHLHDAHSLCPILHPPFTLKLPYS